MFHHKLTVLIWLVRDYLQVYWGLEKSSLLFCSHDDEVSALQTGRVLKLVHNLGYLVKSAAELKRLSYILGLLLTFIRLVETFLALSTRGLTSALLIWIVLLTDRK